MRGSRGGVGSGPPWNLQSLISAIFQEMKKLVIFHICTWDPSLEKFPGSALARNHYR